MRRGLCFSYRRFERIPKHNKIIRPDTSERKIRAVGMMWVYPRRLRTGCLKSKVQSADGARLLARRPDPHL
jgi:hypothetical protein